MNNKGKARRKKQDFVQRRKDIIDQRLEVSKSVDAKRADKIARGMVELPDGSEAPLLAVKLKGGNF